LGGIAEWLTQVFTRIRIQYDVEEVVVVAHSMGGLVTREFLLADFERNGDTAVRTYVTISSPLGGMASAGQGVEHSPVVVNSWRGLAPRSEFLDGLFYADPKEKSVRRRLPGHLTYHMLFGFDGKSGDGVVAISSQLRSEAQEEARSIRGFEETHTGILTSPAAIAHLNAILDQQ
jgi:pimeloyl-ACP methyl ester carboxylesterase